MKRKLATMLLGLLLAIGLTMPVMAEEPSGAGRLIVYKDGRNEVIGSETFNTGKELQALLEKYDGSDHDLYVELYRDLDLGGENGAPLVIDTVSDVDLNLKGHTIRRSFADNDYYDDGYVIMIEPDNENTIIRLYSEINDSRSVTEFTDDPGVITGGQNDDDGGGIVIADDGEVRLINVSVSGNKAADNGGGISVEDTGALLLMQNGSSVSNNEAAGYGGGFYVYWGELRMGYGSVISGNTAVNRGGGVYVCGGLYDGVMNMENGRISGNTVTAEAQKAYGGGIFTAGELTVTGGEISDNACLNCNPYAYTNDGKNGAGIYLDSGSDINSISGVTISNNRADGYGGGIYIDGGDTPRLEKVTISNNKASRGGGIYAADNADLKHCTISGNYAGYGGGVYAIDSMTFRDCEILNNNADYEGGGIRTDTDILTANTTITGNRAIVGGGVFIYADDFETEGWVKVEGNYDYYDNYNNLYLEDGTIFAARIIVTRLTDIANTSICISYKTDGDKIKVSSGDLPDNAAALDNAIWCDDRMYIVRHDGESYLYLKKNDSGNEVKVHFMEELICDTEGNMSVREVGVYGYPKGYPIAEGTFWKGNYNWSTVEQIYTDRPLNGETPSRTATKVTDADGNIIPDLYYTSVKRDASGNQSDKNIRIEKKWNITEDVYVTVRNTENIRHLTFELPEIVPYEPLPDTAYITELNGLDISAYPRAVGISWKNAKAYAEPGKKYQGRITIERGNRIETAGSYRYMDCFAIPFVSVAQQNGEPVALKTGFDLKLTESFDFTLETGQLVLKSVDFGGSQDIVELSAHTGSYVTDFGLASSVPATAAVNKPDGTQEEREILLEVNKSYDTIAIGSDVTSAYSDLIEVDATGNAFYKETGSYGFTRKVEIPDYIKLPDNIQISDLTQDYIVSVTGEPGISPTESLLAAPSLEIIDADEEKGEVSYRLSVTDPMARIYANQTAADDPSADTDLVEIDNPEFTISLDPDVIAYCNENHVSTARLYRICARAAYGNPTQGIGDEKYSETKTWFIAVSYRPECSIVMVKGKETPVIDPDSSWAADTTETESFCGSVISISASPTVDGEAAADMKFLYWESETEGLITDENRNSNPISITVPESDIVLTAVYAPLVTRLEGTLDNDMSEESVTLELFNSKGSLRAVTADVKRRTEGTKCITYISVSEDPDAAVYFASDAKMLLNDTVVPYTTQCDDKGINTLTAQISLDIPVTDPVYTAPSPNELIYEKGKMQKLLTEGYSDDGVFMYSLGTENAAGELYSSSVPKAEEIGTYYIWYYVEGDERHRSTEPEMIAAVISDPNPGLTGEWKKNSKGWWFSCSDGTYPAEGIYTIDDVNYAFNEKGYMVTGWYNGTDSEGESCWYYFASSGAMEYGWVKAGGKWYYLDDESGDMLTGWIEIDGVIYYLTDTGAMATGWNKIRNEEDGAEYWYYFTSSGAMQTGWNKINNKWYYLDPEEDGIMQSGLKYVSAEDRWYYLDPVSGAMQTGWNKIRNEEDGTEYWYYFASSGAMQQSKWIGNYYVDENGIMLTNCWTPDGYWVDATGKYDSSKGRQVS